MVRNAIFSTLATVVLFTTIVIMLVVVDVIGCYRVNYAADYGAYALTFGLGTYIPLYALPVPVIFLMTLLFGTFLGIEKKLSAEEILEYIGGTAMLSAGAFFIAGLIVALVTGPPNMLSRIIFLNGMGGAMVGITIGMLSITSCVLTEVMRNRRIKRMLKKRRESIN